MIQYIQCVKASQHLNLQEFRRYWADYAARVSRFAKVLGAMKVEITTTLAVEANLEVMLRRGTKAPYDGVVEVYFERASQLRPLLDHPEIKALLGELQAFQEEFMDLERSAFFFAAVDSSEVL